MGEEIFRADELFLLHIIVRDGLVIIGHGASEVAAFEERERLTFFHALPGSHFEFGDSSARRRKYVDHSRRVGFDMRSQLQIVRNT